MRCSTIATCADFALHHAAWEGPQGIALNCHYGNISDLSWPREAATVAAQSCTAELIAADNAEIYVLLHLSAGIKVHGIHKMTHVHDGAVRKRSIW